MTFSEIRTLMEQDSIIDPSNLDAASLLIPFLHSKWYNIFITELKILRGIDIEYNAQLKAKTDYYLGKASDEIYEQKPLHMKILKQDVDLYLKADSELVDIETKKQFQKIKVETIESFIKNINNRGFMIKNAIDFRKFVNGIN